jgi:hypothetical protein
VNDVVELLDEREVFHLLSSVLMAMTASSAIVASSNQ